MSGTNPVFCADADAALAAYRLREESEELARRGQRDLFGGVE